MVNENSYGKSGYGIKDLDMNLALLIPEKSIFSLRSEDTANQLSVLIRTSIIPGPEKLVCKLALPLRTMAKNILISRILNFFCKMGMIIIPTLHRAV